MKTTYDDAIPLFALKNAIRNYAWGSYDGLNNWAGIRTDGAKPSAEFWMGAHPDDPSSIVLPDGAALPLPKYIREYPIKSLGEEVFAEFGDLPFLFKVLSASMPLSIQVHPDKAHAQEGFDREDALGIARDAPERNYKDRNPKPELAVALSDFSALCGFRSAAEAAELLGPVLREYFGFSPDSGEASFRSLLSKALTLRDKEKAHLEAMATSRAKELIASGDEAARAAGETTIMCYQHYPHDPGAISPLFMGVHRLKAGQGIYVPAGVMHAYLKGTLLEIMAPSDNVIRGGLTHKHIDVAELMGNLDFSATTRFVEPRASSGDPREAIWDTPAREFQLSRFALADQKPALADTTGPEILLCTEGQATIDCASGALAASGEASRRGGAAGVTLKRGESIFIGAACKHYSLRGPCVVYRARVGSGEAFS